MKLLVLSLAIASALLGCGGSNDSPLFNDSENIGLEQNTNLAEDSSQSNKVGDQIVNLSDELGNTVSGWFCYNQSDNMVGSFVFSSDGSGSVLKDDDTPLLDMTWSESTDNSILMSLGGVGGSQLQTIEFSNADAFSTTDSSIAGVALGPLDCKSQELSLDSTATQQQSIPLSSTLPPNFHNIWFIYHQYSGRRWTAMTFTDGSITTAVNDTIELGVSASRQKTNNVNKWGTYETTDAGEQLVVKFPDWEEPRKYYTTDRSIRMANNFKLTGCFSSQSISELGVDGVVGSTAFSSSTFCFDSNGRFSNDSSLVISSYAPNSLGTSTDGVQGTYSISGNTISLNYANGSSIQTVFGAYRFGEPAPKLAAISIGQRMLF